MEANPTNETQGSEQQDLEAALLRASARNRELREALERGSAASAERERELQGELDVLRRELRRKLRRIDQLKRAARNDRATLRRIRSSAPYRIYRGLKRLPGVRAILVPRGGRTTADRLVAEIERERR